MTCIDTLLYSNRYRDNSSRLSNEDLARATPEIQWAALETYRQGPTLQLKGS